MPAATLRSPRIIADPPRLRASRTAPSRTAAAKAGRLSYRALPFQATATTKDGGYFEGYCAVLNNIDEYGTIMARGCFDADIAGFREAGFIGGLNHNWDQPFGVPEVVRLDGKGLFVGSHVLDTAHGSDVKKLLKGGVIRRVSFGFDVLEQEYLDGPDEVADYWRSVGYQPTDLDRDRARKGALLFKRVRVYEASPVMVAGNQLAEITEVRALRARAAAAGRRMATRREVMKLKLDLLLMDVDAHAPPTPRRADPRDVEALRSDLRLMGIFVRSPDPR